MVANVSLSGLIVAQLVVSFYSGFDWITLSFLRFPTRKLGSLYAARPSSCFGAELERCCAHKFGTCPVNLLMLIPRWILCVFVACGVEELNNFTNLSI